VRSRRPPRPRRSRRGRTTPRGAGRKGFLLLAFAAALAAFEGILRGAGPRLLGALLAASAVAAASLWASPGARSWVARAVALDLGGGGGRRVEAVHLAAGPLGFSAPVRFRGGGCVRVLGGLVDASGRVRLPPGGSGWVVRETVGRGVAPGDVEDRRSGFLRGLLRGPFDPRRARFGRADALDVDVAGSGSPPVATLVYR
jgi:hypothetical protein